MMRKVIDHPVLRFQAHSQHRRSKMTFESGGVLNFGAIC